MISPALYLIPVPISDAPADHTIPAHVVEVSRVIRHFVVEDLRTARRMLKRFDRDFPIGECEFHELNVHTRIEDVPSLLAPLREGKPLGLMSEAGCPAVADPGASLVAVAQREGYRVCPLAGPSSILVSLMASGFNGQGFAFNGYLPVETAAKVRKIRELETLCGRTHQTQIFIETPYRNDKFLKLLADTLRPDTMLCLAADISSPGNEMIITRSAGEWKKSLPEIGKRPAIFLIHRL